MYKGTLQLKTGTVETQRIPLHCILTCNLSLLIPACHVAAAANSAQ